MNFTRIILHVSKNNQPISKSKLAFPLPPLHRSQLNYLFFLALLLSTVLSSCQLVEPISEAPTISGCPDNMSANIDPLTNTAVVMWTPPTATDTEGLSLDVPLPITDNSMVTPTVSSTMPSMHEAVFPQGMTTITYTVTDDSGAVTDSSEVMTASCIFTVTIISLSSPTLICPPDIMETVATIPVSVTWVPPILMNPTDPNSVVTSSHQPSNSFPSGITTVTYMAEDSSGAMITSCTFTVTIIHLPSPTLICPSDIMETAITSVSVTWIPPTLMNPTDPNSIVTSSHQPNDSFTLGSTIVRYTAEDSSGAMITFCTFTVTIVEPPSPPTGSLFILETNDMSPATNNPFLIFTEMDLVKLTTAVNDDMSYTDINGNNSGSYAAASYRLAADITMDQGNTGSDPSVPADTGNFTPIGSSDTINFQGVFDGDSHFISGLRLNTNAFLHVGLFGFTSNATIQDLTLSNSAITNMSNDFSSGDTGVLIGASINTTIREVVISEGTLEGFSFTGGLIGRADNTKVFLSSANLTISQASTRVGGLIGGATNGSLITTSFTSGAVRGSGTRLGGFIGYLDKSAILASYTSSDVTFYDLGNSTGGFVGSMANQASIDASYSRGQTFKTASGVTSSVFGLVGAGALGGTSRVRNSYWDDLAISVGLVNDDNEARSTAQLQNPQSYINLYALWNVNTDDDSTTPMDDPWDFGSSNEYPAIKDHPISVSDQRQ